MIEVERYQPSMAEEWNRHVVFSRNGTFLFDRRYMDYHSDRFDDCSLMFRDERGRLVAVLPANAEDDTLHSHHGLTYGGLVSGDGFRASLAIEAIDAMNYWLSAHGFRHVVYKPTPWIYHRYPSEEDLYALFRRCDFRLTGRDISTAIDLSCPLPFMEMRRRHVKKALREGVTIERAINFADFWQVLDTNLMERYGVHPVHSLKEIELLASRFEAIELFHANREGRVLAGVVVFKSWPTVHVQYISASPEGKALGALDLLFHTLIEKFQSSFQYFEFGKSTEDLGHKLNEGLIFQKEGYGGRGVCYDTYEWSL